jgi:hypothetical protein
MLRLVGAVGTFVLGLHEKREKVHHPGLQHVHEARKGSKLPSLVRQYTERPHQTTPYAPFRPQRAPREGYVRG